MNDQYNPFVRELNAIQEKFKSNAALKENTQAELDWYNAFDKDGTHARLHGLQNAVHQHQAALDRMKPVLIKHTDNVKQAEKKAQLGFNPLYWLSSERQVAVRVHEKALHEMVTFESEYNDTNAKKEQYESEARELQEAMNRYRTFDVLQAEDMVRFLHQEQEMLEHQCTALARRAKDAEALLRPTWEYLKQCTEKENTLIADIAVAQKMDDDLTEANNSYERKQIHQSCEEKFRDSKPHRVRNNLERELHSIRSTIEKTRKRLEIDTLRLTRDVQMLVIDGSNLLNKYDHNNGDQFIGLTALDALMPALADKVEKIILFFDHGAPKKLRMSEQALYERFAQWANEVIVTPMNSPADDTILAAANKNKHAYVISRDRYNDYLAQYPWIKERLFAPIIANGTVHVHDLFLDVPLSQVQ